MMFDILKNQWSQFLLFSVPGNNALFVPSDLDFHLVDLVNWGQNVYAVGGGKPPFGGARLYKPNSTNYDSWPIITGGTVINGTQYSPSILTVPALKIPNLPNGCTGL
jgi:hypothetical protein